MAKVYTIYSSKSDNIHQPIGLFIVGFLPDVEIPHETIIDSETLKFLQKFGSYDEAEKKLSEIQTSNIIEYTKHVILTGMPHVEPFKNRFIVSYVGIDLTPHPGFYTIDLFDFEYLRGKYQSVGLADLEELRQIELTRSSDKSDVVELSRMKLSDKLRIHNSQLKIYHEITRTNVYPEYFTDQDILTFDAEFERILHMTIITLELLNISDIEERRDSIRDLHPLLKNSEIDALYAELSCQYSPLKVKLDELRKVDTSENVILQHIYKWVKSEMLKIEKETISEINDRLGVD